LYLKLGSKVRNASTERLQVAFTAGQEARGAWNRNDVSEIVSACLHGKRHWLIFCVGVRRTSCSADSLELPMHFANKGAMETWMSCHQETLVQAVCVLFSTKGEARAFCAGAQAKWE